MNAMTLYITNLEQMQHGVTARHRFGCVGGTIGSQFADWLIDNRDRTVAPTHCEIRWLEGNFCIIDRCNRTYLNDGVRSLGQHPPVRLQEGDQIRIGSCRLQVQFLHGPASHGSLEELFNPVRTVLDALIADAPVGEWQIERTGIESTLDICETFEPGVGHDPLVALDATIQKEQPGESSLHHLIAGKST